jgi:hypothetical protein
MAPEVLQGIKYSHEVDSMLQERKGRDKRGRGRGRGSVNEEKNNEEEEETPNLCYSMVDWYDSV